MKHNFKIKTNATILLKQATAARQFAPSNPAASSNTNHPRRQRISPEHLVLLWLQQQSLKNMAVLSLVLFVKPRLNAQENHSSSSIAISKNAPGCNRGR